LEVTEISVPHFLQKKPVFAHSEPDGGGELIFGVGSDYPLQARLQAVLGQREISQLRLYSQTEEKGLWGDGGRSFGFLD
jgi:hypothetical protein